MDPVVSIVVPCYKLAHLLSECIESILKQTFQDFEILVMDNCSPDHTPEVVRSIGDARVKYIRNDSNIGHLRNFNRGIAMSRGKYVWLISADDLLRTPRVLDQYVRVLERNPRVGYAFCRAIELQNGKEAGIVRWADCGDEDRIWKGTRFLYRLVESNCIVFSSVIARKECYEQAGSFPLDLPFASDWYLWSLFALHYDVAYFSEPMVCLRLHEDSLTTSNLREDSPVCVSDEFAVRWRVGQKAEAFGLGSLRRACRAALVYRAALALTAGISSTSNRNITEAQLEQLLAQCIARPADQKGVLADVYTRVADIQYWKGEYTAARKFYELALGLDPWRLGSRVKWLLLRSGGVGASVRATVRRLQP